MPDNLSNHECISARELMMVGSFSTPVSLLQQLRNPDDREAMARFVDLFVPVVWVFVRRLNVPQLAQEDLVQDSIMLLLQKLPEFEYSAAGRFRGWLFTVVKNQWRKSLRRGVTEGLPDADIADPSDGPAELVEQHEFNQLILHQAMRIFRSDFEEPTWQAFWRLAIENQTGPETAQQLGMSVAAVYKARSKVLRRLREELDGFFDH